MFNKFGLFNFGFKRALGGDNLPRASLIQKTVFSNPYYNAITGYWEFEDKAGTTTVAEKGKCFNFDGVAYSEVPKNKFDLSGRNYLDLSADFSKEAGEICSVSQGDDSATRFELSWAADNKVYAIINEGSGYASFSFTDYGKHTFRALYDGSGATNNDKIKVFIDGEEQVISISGTINSSLQPFTRAFRIGQTGTSTMSTGKIANVKIYDIAGNLTNSWHCDEDSGDTAYDSVGTAHATIVDAGAGFFDEDIEFTSYHRKFGYSLNESGYPTDVYIPIKLNNDGTPTSLDIFGNTPTVLGQAKNNIKIVDSNCGNF